MECDGRRLELPEDIEGLLLLNINSYMGGVDLWASGASLPGRSPHAKQSFCDGRLEVSTTETYESDLYSQSCTNPCVYSVCAFAKRHRNDICRLLHSTLS